VALPKSVTGANISSAIKRCQLRFSHETIFQQGKGWVWYATPVLMKILFVLLVLSTVAVLVAVVAMWWRLRRHMRASNEALKQALSEIQPEHESVEQR
jgi:flagellar biosynthesis protein FlhB